MKTSDDLQLLRELRNDGKLIPFVGAGLSQRFSLPFWSDLIGTIAEELVYDPDVFNCNGTKEQLAEYYVATKGSIGPLRSLMDQAFNPGDDKIRNSRASSFFSKAEPRGSNPGGNTCNFTFTGSLGAFIGDR
jgi:hypothetical protein